MVSPFDQGAYPDLSLTDLTAPTDPYTPPPLPGVPTDLNPTNLLGGLEQGASGILAIFNAVTKALPQLATTINNDIAAPLGTILANAGKFLRHAEYVFDEGQVLSWGALTDIFPTSALFHEMLTLGLGLNIEEFDQEAQDGVHTVDRMLAFAFLFPMVAAAIEAAGKPLLANRWASGISEAIRKLPEEMGFSWALGLQIDESFKTAVGRSIEEGINRQKTPNRIDWRILKTLVKQNVITPEILDNLLLNLGFPTEQRQWIEKLADVNLPVGDIQQLYLYNEIDADGALSLIKKNGFSDDDAEHVKTLYIDKAETASASVLRSTARQLFREYLITEDHYRQILTDTNFPPREIDNDIKAINLEHEVGRINNTVAVIKSRRLHNIIDDAEAVTKVHQLGYSLTGASDLVASWLATPIHPKHGLSQSKILSYLISGVLNSQQALPLLLDTGLDSNSANILINNPSAHPQVTKHQLSPGFVITAYLDGALDKTNLSDAFTRAGVKDVDLQYWLTVADYRYKHRKIPPGGTIGLTKAEILEAYKYNVYDYHQANLALTALNIDATAIDVLLEIVNKGPFTQFDTATFPTTADAVSYLEGQGFKIYFPPSPKTALAEQILGQNGYTFVAPLPEPIAPPL